MMHSSNTIVDVAWLAKQTNVTILDVSYAMKPKPDHNEFMTSKYGRFNEMMAERENADFAAEHIPGSVHFDLDVASYPGQFARFDLYPPSLFSEYMRLLGVNSENHIVLVGRGPAAGMLFAARAWWLLKAYGHENVSVLAGGLVAWKQTKLQVVSGRHAAKTLGNFSSASINPAFLISFEELTRKDEEGESMLDNCEKLNFLDVRAAEQYNGTAPLGVPAKHATGSHVRGAKSLPLTQLMTEKGPRQSEEIIKALRLSNFHASSPTVTSCVTGVQAALLSLILYENKVQSRLYNGSLLELGARASHLINGKHQVDEYN